MGVRGNGTSKPGVRVDVRGGTRGQGDNLDLPEVRIIKLTDDFRRGRFIRLFFRK